jgi:PTS system glucitol/sorbitol-specific IIC component
VGQTSSGPLPPVRTMPGKHHDQAQQHADSTGAIMPFTSMAAMGIPLAADTPTVDPPTGVFGALADAADWFIGLFQAGGDVFLGLVTGIIPTLIVLLTFVNALIRLIGPEKIDKLGEYAARPGLQYYPVRYLVLPVLAVFFLTNPMAYTMGRFLPEKYKPAFYDSAVSFVHPITGIFPHANPGELFVYLGIAAGITTLGLNTSDLAVRYLLVGLVVIMIRGVLTEIITTRMLSRRATQAEVSA